MKILNLGSLNFDKVYQLEHFVGAKETVLANDFAVHLGGKGLNQSLALARAGAEVYHAGAIGTDGEPFIKALKEAGVDTRYLAKLNAVSGHAVIQVVDGQNCIIVCGGTNQLVTEAHIDNALKGFAEGDMLLVQNETSCIAYAMKKAREKGMKIAFNASPITEQLFSYPLDLVDYYLINEVEGKALADCDSTDVDTILEILREKYHGAMILTVGEKGAYYQKGTERYHTEIYQVPVVDTTAAGDTFCGYFLASIVKGEAVQTALRTASVASGLAVSREGAANSIPLWDEVAVKISEE